MPRPKGVRPEQIGIEKSPEPKQRKRRKVLRPFGAGSAGFWAEAPGVDLETVKPAVKASDAFENMAGRLRLFARRAKRQEPVARPNDWEALNLEPPTW